MQVEIIGMSEYVIYSYYLKHKLYVCYFQNCHSFQRAMSESCEWNNNYSMTKRHKLFDNK